MRRLACLVVLALLAVAPPSVPAVAAVGAVIEGRARAVDGDTLDMGGQKVRLFGVDAPELDQSCDRGGKVWACGAAARDMLAEIVGRARLTCSVEDVDRYGRLVAVCTRAGEDVGAALVRQGGAIAYLRYSSRYANAEAAARRDGLGLWQAVWITPEAHRHAAAPGAAPAGGCVIKGNIGSTGKRIYHLPGQADYEATRISERKGERWFCSEAEARAAGFRRAAR